MAEKKSSTPDKPAAEPREQAAAQAPETEEWIYTFHSATGEVVKVERVDPTSGDRQELTEDDYSALAFAVADTSGAEGGGGADQATYEAAYYQGLIDYETALTQAASFDETAAVQEAAYYQGMADYEALLGQSGMSAEEAAYYQGMSDYATALGHQ